MRWTCDFRLFSSTVIYFDFYRRFYSNVANIIFICGCIISINVSRIGYLYELRPLYVYYKKWEMSDFLF